MSWYGAERRTIPECIYLLEKLGWVVIPKRDLLVDDPVVSKSLILAHQF